MLYPDAVSLLEVSATVIPVTYSTETVTVSLRIPLVALTITSPPVFVVLKDSVPAVLTMTVSMIEGCQVAEAVRRIYGVRVLKVRTLNHKGKARRSRYSVGRTRQTRKAVVTLHPGRDLSAEALIGYCKQNLAAYKYPRIVEFSEGLPKGPTGKILKRELS